MRKYYFVLSLLLILQVTGHAQAKKIAGLWEGKINTGVALRIVFHFNLNADGSYSATMDSPDQGAKGIVCSSVQLKEDSVRVTVESIKGSYVGSLSSDSLITGKWMQGPSVFPLNLKQVTRLTPLNRPQTPKPPYAYNSEDISYTNKNGSIHYGATLTYPKTGGPFATAILITGSGQQDRDESLFEHKPFAVIADYLTTKGFAVLRVDDRGVGQTNGEVQTATSLDFAGDVEAGLQYLKTRKEVNKNKLGLIGHSEGGLIASIVAARNKDIDFVIMLAGPGVKGSDLLTEQAGAVIQGYGIPATTAAAYKPIYKTMIETAISEKDTAAAFAKANTAFQQWKVAQSETVLKTLGFTGEQEDVKMMRNLLAAFASPWMKYFLSTDPQPLMQQFNCKVLALNGSKDVQVIAAQNLPGIKAAQAKSKSKQYETLQLEGLNHLFQHCKTCSVAEYGVLEESFAPEALEKMGNWLQQYVQSDK